MGLEKELEARVPQWHRLTCLADRQVGGPEQQVHEVAWPAISRAQEPHGAQQAQQLQALGSVQPPERRLHSSDGVSTAAARGPFLGPAVSSRQAVCPPGREAWEDTSGQARNGRNETPPPARACGSALPSQVGTRRFSSRQVKAYRPSRPSRRGPEPTTVLKRTPARLPTAHIPATRRTRAPAPDPMHRAWTSLPLHIGVSGREMKSQDPGWGGPACWHPALGVLTRDLRIGKRRRT